MNIIEQELLLYEIKNGTNLKSNLIVVDKLISSANAWNSLHKWIKENKDIRPFKEESSEELFRDQCFSASTHIIYLIEYLLENIDESTKEDVLNRRG